MPFPSSCWLFALLVLFCTFSTCNCEAKSETNGARMRRGLPPATPNRLYTPSRVRRDYSVPSPTSCSLIGSQNMAIEMHKSSDGSFLGYIGHERETKYDVVYKTFSPSGEPKSGLFFNVTYDPPYNIAHPHNSIGVPSLNTYFCATTQQRTQNLLTVDASYTAEPQK
ncbi:hypothetical protein B0H10DRAFT_1940143 [Mycena sp. CBHHK59/15]|nr:hypothetical protein B0H10DRAFT_1940143 [Mycena sp. CBHHK59/15]